MMEANYVGKPSKRFELLTFTLLMWCSANWAMRTVYCFWLLLDYYRLLYRITQNKNTLPTLAWQSFFKPFKKKRSYSFWGPKNVDNLYMLKYINIPVFLVSFALGIFAVYVTAPDTKKIVVYPTPDSVHHVQYKDKAGNCFQFKQTRSTCPKDAKKTPLQT